MSGRILGVVLRIAARTHVEHDSPPPVLLQAGVRKGEAKLRLADAGRAGQDGERARHQAAAEMGVEFANPRAKSILVVHRFSIGLPGRGMKRELPRSMNSHTNGIGAQRGLAHSVDRLADFAKSRRLGCPVHPNFRVFGDRAPEVVRAVRWDKISPVVRNLRLWL